MKKGGKFSEKEIFWPTPCSVDHQLIFMLIAVFKKRFFFVAVTVNYNL